MSSSRLAAWGVHLYTASGAVVALLALVASQRGAFGAAFAWLALAIVIDSTDGTLARRARVKEVLPHFDGSKLDDIVDYLTYVLVPIFIAHTANLLPSGSMRFVVAAAPLLASAYGFCQSAAKTSDHFFTGFPSYWNVVVFYLYALAAPMWFNVVILLGLSVMVFVPIRYLYPSRGPVARNLTYVLGIIWGVLFFLLLFQFPHPSRAFAILTLFFPIYYVAMSFYAHFTYPHID